MNSKGRKVSQNFVYNAKMHSACKTTRDKNRSVCYNENVYSIIHMVLNGESIIIPFTLKKSTCDTLYSFLMEKVTIEDVSADPEEKV